MFVQDDITESKRIKLFKVADKMEKFLMTLLLCYLQCHQMPRA